MFGVKEYTDRRDDYIEEIKGSTSREMGEIGIRTQSSRAIYVFQILEHKTIELLKSADSVDS